jgi:hypothetical protein
MAKKSEFPQEILDLYDALIQTQKGIERKGLTMPYASLNGNMFSFLDKKGQLGLRLPEKEREEFMRKYKTTLCEAHGTFLKEYVLVPEKLFKKTSELKPYFTKSVNYVKSLKAKSTKR